MPTATYTVSGLTCDHCVHAVKSEFSALSGVSEVTVDLVPGGESKVTVTSDAPLALDDVRTALDEAGDYQLVSA
jgi:copper chaperone CopZ